MADVVEKRLNMVISSQNEAEPALRAVEGLLGDLKGLAESLTSAFRSVLPAVREAETAVRTFGETASQSVRSVSSAGEGAAGAVAAAWRQLAEDAARTSSEITESFQRAGAAIRESLNVGAVRAEMAPAKGGGAGGPFSPQGSMDLFFGGLSLAGIAAPAIEGFKSAIESYMEFEKAASAVNTMLQLNQEQFQALENRVRSLALTVPETSTELMKGLYGIVGAGVDATQALDVLRVVAEAAAAGQTDMENATRAVVSALNAYGMDAFHAAEISDILFAANSAAQASFDDFARSIGTVIGPAANAGVSFRELTAALGALTNSGLSAQQAAEDLRALINGIINPSKEAQKTAQALGIEWNLTALKAKGLTGMLQDLKAAAGDNEEAIKKVVGTEAALNAALGLTGKAADSFKQALDAVNNSAGATAKAMEALKQTPTYKIEEFKKSLDEFGKILAAAVMPTLAKLAEIGMGVMNWFQSLPDGVRTAIANVALFGTTLLVVAGGAMMLLSSIGQAALGLKVLKEAFGAVSNTAKIMSSGVITAIRGIAVAMMSNPILVAIAAIIAAVAVVTYLVITHWNQIKTWTVNTFSAIRDWVVGAWSNILQFFATLPERALGFFRQLLEGVALFIGELIGFVVLGIPRFVETLVQGAANAYHGFINWVSQLPGALWNWLVQAVYHVGVWAGQIWQWAVNAGSNFIHSIGNWLAQLPGNFMSWLNEAINAIASFPGRLYQWGVNLVRSFIQGIRDWAGGIKDAFIQGFERARAVIEGHSPPVEGPFKDIDKWGANVARAYVDGILSQRRAMVAAMRDLVQAGASVAMVNRPAFAFAGGGGVANIGGPAGNTTNIGQVVINVPVAPSPEDPKAFAQRLAWYVKTSGR